MVNNTVNFFRGVRCIYKYSIYNINNINGTGQGCGTHVQELTKHLINSCDSWDGGRVQNFSNYFVS